MRLRLSLSNLTAIALLACLSTGTIASADPVFVFDGPWVNRGFTNDLRGAGASGYNFTQGGNTALAQISVDSSHGFFGATSHAFASLTFTRGFGLAGSPGGWDIDLQTSLFGQLFTENDRLNPKASVSASVDIFRLGGSDPILSYRFSRSVEDDTHIFLSEFDSQTTFVTGGRFEIVARIDVGSQLDGSNLRSGVAFSGFGGFGSDGSPFVPGFQVAVFATPVPVPEPSSLSLSGVGLLVGFGAWSRRRRLRPAS
jgi:hypothetical protein